MRGTFSREQILGTRRREYLDAGGDVRNTMHLLVATVLKKVILGKCAQGRGQESSESIKCASHTTLYLVPRVSAEI